MEIHKTEQEVEPEKIKVPILRYKEQLAVLMKGDKIKFGARGSLSIDRGGLPVTLDEGAEIEIDAFGHDQSYINKAEFAVSFASLFGIKLKVVENNIECAVLEVQ